MGHSRNTHTDRSKTPEQHTNSQPTDITHPPNRPTPKLHDGSRNVSVVLRNLTGKPVHLPARRPVARVVAANAIPDAAPSPEFLRKLDEMEPARDSPRKLIIEERQQLLLELLRKEGWLDKLKEWPLELALKFERMLMEHHNIFSLEPNKIGCTMQRNMSLSCWTLNPSRNSSGI